MVGLAPVAEAGVRHVFLDPALPASATGVQLVVNPPRKEQVVIRPDQPWEKLMITFYLSVIDDHGVIRMWYDCRDQANSPNLAYAESSDGINWRKPSLGLVDYHGSRANNLVGIPNFEGNVFLDPHATDANQRFVYVTSHGDGIFRFASPDGLKWICDPRPLLSFMADSQNVTDWDPTLGRYVLFFRGWNPHQPQGHQRNVVRMEAERLDAPLPIHPAGLPGPPGAKRPVIQVEAPTVLACDEQDPPQTDVYTNAIQRYRPAPDWLVGFPAFYRHDDQSPVRNDGRTEVQFIASHDGKKWERYQREPYVAPGLVGSDSANMVFIGTGLIYRGDEIWQYGTGYRTTHGDLIGRQRRTDGVISRYVQRIDGFVSLDFGPAGGSWTSDPELVDSGRLHLNLDPGAEGELRVALLHADGQPIPGFEAERCAPLQANATDAVVTWSGQSDLTALHGERVVVAISGSRTKLYSWRFE